MPKSSAPAPSRSTASVTLAWGLVNVPLAVYSATQPCTIARKEFTADGHPVGRAAIDKETGKVVTNDSIVKMAPATNGTMVAITDQEMSEWTAPNARCEVVCFIPLDSIGSVYLPDANYQVRPQRSKTKGTSDLAAQQAFALLFTSMARRGVAALVRIALRGPAKYAAITPDGRMTTLYYAEGVRESLPMPDVALPAGAEAMADQLIDLVGVDLPSLDDTTGAAVQAQIDAKAGGCTPPPTTPTEAPVNDVMGALMASIEAKKPAKGKGKGKGKAA
jgi:Ku protein